MSNDQKPARIKLVSNGGPARVPQNATPEAAGAEAEAGKDGQGEDAGPDTGQSGGSSLVPKVLFLSGCALGGVSLAAWPYLAG